MKSYSSALKFITSPKILIVVDAFRLVGDVWDEI